MRGSTINLNQARKAKARSEAEAVAAANRVKYGRTKAQKQADVLNTDRSRQSLDGKKRET